MRRELGPEGITQWDASAGAAMTLMFVAYAVLNAAITLWFFYRRSLGRPGPAVREEPRAEEPWQGPRGWSHARAPPPPVFGPRRDPALDWAYRELHLPPDADLAAVKRAFRELALHYHPDRNPSADASARFRNIKAAYDALIGQPAR